MNELLLGELRTNHERVILPSSRSKIKKKLSSLTNQHSVILPAMLLWSEIMLVISNRTHAARSFNFEITRMISDQIALHSVQLPLQIFVIYKRFVCRFFGKFIFLQILSLKRIIFTLNSTNRNGHLY